MQPRSDATGTIRCHRGLTLTELIVVLAILGAMATAIVPAAQVLLKKAESDNVEASLTLSWRMAHGLAQSRQQTVLWRVSAVEHMARATVVDARGDVLWSTSWRAEDLQMRAMARGEPNRTGEWRVYPHGISGTVEFQWNAPDGKRTHKLPADLPAAQPLSSREGG